MIVVSDKTPLISLMKVGHLELEHEVLGEIIGTDLLLMDEAKGRHISSKLYEQLLERLKISDRSICKQWDGETL